MASVRVSVKVRAMHECVTASACTCARDKNRGACIVAHALGLVSVGSIGITETYGLWHTHSDLFPLVAAANRPGVTRLGSLANVSSRRGGCGALFPLLPRLLGLSSSSSSEDESEESEDDDAGAGGGVAFRFFDALGGLLLSPDDDLRLVSEAGAAADGDDDDDGDNADADAPLADAAT